MSAFSPERLSSLAVGAALALFGVVGIPAPGSAQDRDTDQAVARISYLSGDVSYSRGDDPDDWQAPARNVPFTLGDRIYSSQDGRVELQIHGGEFIRMAPRTDLAALNLSDEVRQFSLTSGTASFQLRRLDENETFEVDTPNVAVTFERPGDYRIDVDGSGNTRVSCFQGEASVAAGGGEVPLRAGEQMWIDGIDNPQYDVAALDEKDSWDKWVASREARFARVSAYRYVNFNIDGVDDLEEYGRWTDIPGYGTCWSPASVEVGWQPYRLGRWIWQDPWGWTWIADEPWGWAPYHYGRWVVYGSQWYWVPAGPSVAVEYSPALVAFIGAGPGGAGDYVGWFPLAPRDPFLPWWSTRARVNVNVNVNVTNVTYVNRTYVTVVNRNTFASGGAVSVGAVRDAQVVRQLAAGPVVRGPLQVVPTPGALRVSTRAAVSIARPPAAGMARAVVTRVPPPPAPATFQAKLNTIRENRGAPVSASAAAQLSVETRGGARAVAPVRPVVAEKGRVTFEPRNAQSRAPRAAPVTEHHGRPLATMDRPIVAGAPAKIAPGAVVEPRNVPVAPSREGAPPRTFERAVPPGAAPAPAPPPAQTPEEWRRRAPGPPPDRSATPAAPPPDQAAPPAVRPPGRSDRTPPPSPGDQTPPPGPPRNASPDRGQSNNPKDRGKKSDRQKAKDKDKKDKDKKDEPPPPPR